MDIEEASRYINSIYNAFEKLRRAGLKSEVIKLLTSKDFDNILIVNSVAKDKALR